MTARLALVVLALAAALALMPPAEPPSPAPAGSAPPPAPREVPGDDEPPAPEGLAVLAERPLFAPDRRPPPEPVPAPQEAAPEEEAEPAQEPAEEPWRLVGIAGFGGRLTALVRAPGQDGPVPARVGDRILGWTVAAVTTDLVLLRDPVTGRTMRLRTGE